LQENEAQFRGYQDFNYHFAQGFVEPLNDGLKNKFSLVEKFFTSAFFARRTVLDLGGNNGFYSFAALKAGALEANVVDIDENAIKNIWEFKKNKPDTKISGHLQKVYEWQKPADIVFAFALIHWIFNLTEETENKLAKPLKHLSNISRDALFVEWVDPTDEVIKNYDHINRTAGLADEYTEENFVALLKNEFSTVRLIGSVSDTRRLYLCHQESFNFDLSWDEPLLYQKSTLVSSRILCVLDENPIWSRVYKLENNYVKQVTKSIGLREFETLKSPIHAGIPVASNLAFGETAVSFSLETMPGVSLDKIYKSDALRYDEVAYIACQLIELIASLEERGLIHRDIHPGNILYCMNTQRVSLIDFGWAARFGEDAPTPEGLGFWWGFDGRAPEPERSDVYSWGCLILFLLGDFSSTVRIPAAWARAKSVYIRPKANELLAILSKLATDEKFPASDIRLRRFFEELAELPLKKEKLEREQFLLKQSLEIAHHETRQARAETQQARTETQQARTETQQARAETQQSLEELSRFKAESVTLKIRLAEVARENNELAVSLAQIRTSRSWKLTTPLRLIVAKFRLLLKI
jgi:serine/threonine protein kinase